MNSFEQRPGTEGGPKQEIIKLLKNLKEKPHSLRLAMAAVVALSAPGEALADSDSGEIDGLLKDAEARFIELTEEADSVAERGPVLWKGVMRSVHKPGADPEQTLDFPDFPNSGSGTFKMDSVAVNAYAYDGESSEAFSAFQQQYVVYDSEVVAAGEPVELSFTLESDAADPDLEVINTIAEWADVVIGQTVSGDVKLDQSVDSDNDILHLFNEGFRSHSEFPISWEIVEQMGDDGDVTYTVKIQPGTVARE